MRTLVLLLLLLAPALLSAAAWDPITPETWAIRETQGADDRGAVFVKTHRIFGNQSYEYHCRLRIYSERGKASANWPAFPKNTYELRGRTVYPDGKEKVFESEKDFHPFKRVETKYGSMEQTAVVPPGLTTDCVVDLVWKCQGWIPINSFGGYGNWDLTEAFPVQTMVLEVTDRSWFVWAYQPGSPENLAATQEARGHESTLYTLKNLPPRTEIPFSLMTTRHTPRFIAYVAQVRAATAGKDATQRFWLTYVERMKDYMSMRNARGEAYEAFSTSLREGLPPGRRAQAFELALRLRAKIRSLDYLTNQEEAERTRKAASREIEPRNLEDTVKRGETTGQGMLFLYLQLLKDAGLHPKLAYAANRNLAVFDPEDKNVGIFEKGFLGIDEPGQGTLWVEPSRRFGAPGLIRPEYQGTAVLVVDPETWTWTTAQLPVHGPSASRREETYRMEILEEEDRFSLETRFSGNQEITERLAYYQAAPEEQNRKLREGLENQFKNFKVSLAEVSDAANPLAGIHWRVQGSLEREGARTRKVLPFPLTHYPLALPDDLPATRTDLIVLPEASLLNARCTFRVPEGHVWVEAPAFERSNAFGKVILKAGPREGSAGAEIEAILRVEVALPLAPASQWPALVEYLGWIREAFDHPFFLERTGK